MSYKRTNPEVLVVGINNEEDGSETYRFEISGCEVSVVVFGKDERLPRQDG